MLRTGETLLGHSSIALCMLRMRKHNHVPSAVTQARVQQESERHRGEELAGRWRIASVFDLSIDLLRHRGSNNH